MTVPDQAPQDLEGLMHCILDDCEWTLAVPRLKAPEKSLASAFGLDVQAAVESQARAAKIEKDLETHLKSHSVHDWVMTLKSLRDDLHWAQDLLTNADQSLTAYQAKIAELEQKLREAHDAVRVGLGVSPSQGRGLDVTSVPRTRRLPETPRYAADLPEGVVGRKT
jgi:hypothetical protein